MVLYAARPTADQQGVGFARGFEWDTPLRDGYKSRIVRDAAAAADFSSESFRGLDVREIGDAVLSTEPDVVLVPGWHSITLVRAILACRRKGIPVLYRGDTNLRSRRSGWRRLAWRAKTRAMLRLYSAHLAVGRLSREYLLAHGVSPTRIYASPHAVDNDFFAGVAAPFLTQSGRSALRAKYGCGPNDFAVLFAGKLSAGKRPIDAVGAVGRLGPDAVLVVAGSGEQEPVVRAEAERLRVRVAWLGFVNQTEMGCAYAAADCLVVPSESASWESVERGSLSLRKWAESWGLVVNEAMATGLPAVVSDAVGCGPDLVSAGETGEVFRSGDVGDLTDALARVRRRGGRDQMAPACRERAAEYTFQSATVGLTAACHAVVRGRRAAPARVMACCGGMVVVSGLERMTFEVLRVAHEHGAAVHCVLNSWENHRIVPLVAVIGASWSTGLFWYDFNRHTRNPVRHAQALWDIVRTSVGLLRDARRFRPTHVLVPDHTVVVRNAPALVLLRVLGVEVVFRVANAPERGKFHLWLWKWVVAPAVTRLVANSQFARTRLLDVPVPARKIMLIRNAVSRRPGAANRDGDIVALAASRRTLLVVGQIAPFKGTHLIVDAGLRLLEHHSDLQILIVGALPTWPPDLVDYARDLETRIAAAGLAQRIRFVGARTNVVEIMRVSYLLVAPILQEETFGNVVLEAKTAGLPSVVFPKGGLVELVEHRESGFVCRGDSVKALVEGLTFYLSNPGARDRARRRCLDSSTDPRSDYAFTRFERCWVAVFDLDRPAENAAADVVAADESTA